MESIKINKLTTLDFAGSEAYKTLRSNIQFCGHDIKTIGLTSCTPNEGKSSVSLNLAVAMAESGKKVVFIDADLRKSVLIGRYKISKAIKGLVHFLSGINTYEEVLYKTNIDNLYMILSGPVPPNPSELLDGKVFRNLIIELEKSYDYIVIDTPPLGSVIDSAVISNVCNGMIMVIESNAISYKLAQRVKEQLEKTECKILGAVLNKVDISGKSYYSSYYGKYYGKEYGKDESTTK
jgi:capsular exopolysaccharide synthesis family protein